MPVILLHAIQLQPGLDPMIERAVAMIWDSFALIDPAGFGLIPCNWAIILFDGECLNANEDQVFAAIASYIKSNATTLSSPQVETLWKTCRFAFVSPALLSESIDGLPADWLSLSLTSRLLKGNDAQEQFMTKRAKLDSDSTCARLRPRNNGTFLSFKLRFHFAGSDLSCWDWSGVDIGIDSDMQRECKALLNHEITGKVVRNIMTIETGVLAVSVAFGSAGDDDQQLAVLTTPATDDATYELMRRATGVMHNNPPMVFGQLIAEGSKTWHLKGRTINMVLDANDGYVGFWEAESQQHTKLNLPKKKQLTAAFGIYDNMAKVIGLRYFPLK